MKAMGIARQSLYDTFGDKRALFEGALLSGRDQQRDAAERRDDQDRLPE